jgi:hypothetical protein
LGDILELLLAHVLAGQLKLTSNLPVGIFGDTNATGLRKPFQACGNIHTIAKDVATVEHDIPDIDADAKLNPVSLWHIGVSLSHAPLDIDGTTHRIHYAAELCQQPISGVLDDPTTVLSDLGIDQGAQVVGEPDVRPLFIQAGQAAIASDISREDSGKASLYTLDSQGDLPLNYRDHTTALAQWLRPLGV